MQEQITKDLTAALKEGNKEVVSVLRLLKNALANARIAKREDLTEADTVAVLQREAKQRRDSIESYTQGDRQDLADKEQAELAIIEKYLPAQMSDEDLNAIIERTIASTGASSAADMGKVMGALQPQIAGKADGGRVAALVRAKLQ